MKVCLFIAGLFLLFEAAGIFQLLNQVKTETCMKYTDGENEEGTEENEKRETEFKKFDYTHHYSRFSIQPKFLSKQQSFLYYNMTCLKGHCQVIEQPPEV